VTVLKEAEVKHSSRSSVAVPVSEDQIAAMLDLFAGPAEPMLQSERHRSHRRSRRLVLLVVVVAALAVGGAGTALGYHYFGPSPGFTAGFSAFDRLPVVAVPPSMSDVGFEHMAAYLGLSLPQAKERLRLLQTDLSLGPQRGEGGLYALLGKNGTACMFVSGHGGTCIDSPHLADTSGVLAQVEPGYPAETPAVAALLADNVSHVGLEINGRSTSLRILNNSLFVELTDLQRCSRIALSVLYADGSGRTIPLVNPLGRGVTVPGTNEGRKSGSTCSR
jgi:hypothetical protein